MPTLGQLHFVSALVALGAGAFVLLDRKGTTRHRRVGWTYALAMLLLNATALLIYRLTASFGPFHVAALVSLATLLAGVVPMRRRRPASWLERHYFARLGGYDLGGQGGAPGDRQEERRARDGQMLAHLSFSCAGVE